MTITTDLANLGTLIDGGIRKITTDERASANQTVTGDKLSIVLSGDGQIGSINDNTGKCRITNSVIMIAADSIYASYKSPLNYGGDFDNDGILELENCNILVGNITTPIAFDFSKLINCKIISLVSGKVIETRIQKFGTMKNCDINVGSSGSFVIGRNVTIKNNNYNNVTYSVGIANTNTIQILENSDYSGQIWRLVRLQEGSGINFVNMKRNGLPVTEEQILSSQYLIKSTVGFQSDKLKCQFSKRQKYYILGVGGVPLTEAITKYEQGDTILATYTGNVNHLQILKETNSVKESTGTLTPSQFDNFIGNTTKIKRTISADGYIDKIDEWDSFDSYPTLEETNINLSPLENNSQILEEIKGIVEQNQINSNEIKGIVEQNKIDGEKIKNITIDTNRVVTFRKTPLEKWLINNNNFISNPILSSISETTNKVYQLIQLTKPTVISRLIMATALFNINNNLGTGNIISEIRSVILPGNFTRGGSSYNDITVGNIICQGKKINVDQLINTDNEFIMDVLFNEMLPAGNYLIGFSFPIDSNNFPTTNLGIISTLESKSIQGALFVSNNDQTTIWSALGYKIDVLGYDPSQITELKNIVIANNLALSDKRVAEDTWEIRNSLIAGPPTTAPQYFSIAESNQTTCVLLRLNKSKKITKLSIPLSDEFPYPGSDRQGFGTGTITPIIRKITLPANFDPTGTYLPSDGLSLGAEIFRGKARNQNTLFKNQYGQYVVNFDFDVLVEPGDYIVGVEFSLGSNDYPTTGLAFNTGLESDPKAVLGSILISTENNFLYTSGIPKMDLLTQELPQDITIEGEIENVLTKVTEIDDKIDIVDSNVDEIKTDTNTLITNTETIMSNTTALLLFDKNQAFVDESDNIVDDKNLAFGIITRDDNNTIKYKINAYSSDGNTKVLYKDGIIFKRSSI